MRRTGRLSKPLSPLGDDISGAIPLVSVKQKEDYLKALQFLSLGVWGCALEKVSRETKEGVGGSNHIDLFSNAVVRGQWSYFEAIERIGEA
jgi:hypothetical protein